MKMAIPIALACMVFAAAARNDAAPEHEARGTKHAARGTPHEARGTARGTRHATWHEARRTWHEARHVARGTPHAARHEFTQIHMGVPVRIALHHPDEAAARAAARHAFARMAALGEIMSDYRRDSELRRLERRPGEWVRVSRDLFDVLARAVEIARRTGGAFDPTVGPLVVLWREARRTRVLPDPALLAEARARVGSRLLHLDEARTAARLAVPGMRLDLGGIAKGYILQEALGSLRAAGVSRALIEAGGDIVAGDAPPDRDGWRIEVPGAGQEFAARAARLKNAALATSGPGVQFVEIEGRRYSHVVDARTGLGLTSPRIVHVIAADGATADALATAFTVLDESEARGVMASMPLLAVEIRPE